MSEAQIFLSYSRKDSEVAKKFVSDIMSRGGNIWMDQLHIKSGMRWDRAIEKALEESSHLMVLLTSSSIDSDNVMDEVSYALEENKTIITALVENCKIPFRLRRFQYIDFTQDYENGLKQILSFLNISIDGGKEASIKKPKDLSKTKNVKKIQKPVRPKTDKVIKPAPKKDTEIIPNINKGSESDSSTQCPHCKSKVTTEDKTNVDCPKCNKLFFEDERDGNIYKAVRIGDQIWMAENFRFEEIKGSWCYDNKKVNCKKYGRLYNWETAMKISPKGWHLPSIDEWEKLIEYCGSRDAGKNLKSRSGWHKEGNGVDKFNFSALPGGYYSSDGKFDSLEWSANFLVSTKCDSHKIWNIDLYAVFDFVKENNLASIDNGNSVRYIKD